MITKYYNLPPLTIHKRFGIAARKFIMVHALCLLPFLINAQVLIDPSGDGGMESGSGLPANNWLTATDGGNNWATGAAA
ncbi:MAG: hypothetical protein EOO10_24595, partial [Chitinophagaceae bacterium]